LDPDVIDKTRKKMRDDGDEYEIDIIKRSIMKNGWQPVDFIFVRRFTDKEDRFVVLEGNRRVVAVKELLEAHNTPIDTRAQIEHIEVMEIVDKIDKRRPAESKGELDKKISYLLGVRHHGSLKKWSPFAQAANIHEKYLVSSGQTDATFQWNPAIATGIAETLSMPLKEVKERLQVFRAMKQIGQTPRIKKSESGQGDDKGGIKDNYYSVTKEVLLARSPGLKKYISQDQDDFLLDDHSLERIMDLCHFDRKDRKGSPIVNPQQWRFLGKILDDEEQSKRIANLERVEKEKEKPEDVWAEREAEILSPEWGRWLREVARIFQGLTLAHLDVNDDSRAVMTRLASLLSQLEGK
jgi:hypothetical protein